MILKYETVANITDHVPISYFQSSHSSLPSRISNVLPLTKNVKVQYDLIWYASLATPSAWTQNNKHHTKSKYVATNALSFILLKQPNGLNLFIAVLLGVTQLNLSKYATRNSSRKIKQNLNL